MGSATCNINLAQTLDPRPDNVITEEVVEFRNGFKNVAGFSKFGGPGDIKASIEDLLFGEVKQPGIWCTLSTRIRAVQGAYEFLYRQLDLTDLTNSVDNFRSWKADLLAAPATSPFKHQEEALEVLQKQWGEVLQVMKLIDPLTQSVSSTSNSQSSGDANLPYILGKLEEIIKSDYFGKFQTAVLNLSDLDDELERERSILEGDYEARRMDKEEPYRQHNSSILPPCSCGTLRSTWLTGTQERLLKLADGGIEHSEIIKLIDPKDSFNWLFSPLGDAMREVGKARVSGHSVDFPEMETVQANMVRRVEDDWKYRALSTGLVDVYKFFAPQMAIAKALPALYAREKMVAELLSDCQIVDVQLQKTLEYAKFWHSALFELHSVLARELKPQCESLLLAIADLYESMQVGDPEDVEQNLDGWLRQNNVVKDVISRLGSRTTPAYPLPLKCARAQAGSFSIPNDKPAPKVPLGIESNNILWGISRFDIESNENLRLQSSLRDGTTPEIKTWGQTRVINALVSWIELPSDPLIQYGYSSTDGRDMCHNRTPGDHDWDFEVKFSRAYDSIPEVVCWLTYLDIDNCANTRIDVSAVCIRKDSCTVRVRTWWDTKIWGIGFGWLAHPPNHPTVFATTRSFTKRGIFGGGPGEREGKNGGTVVEFPTAMRQKKAPPIVAAFVKGFDNDKRKFHRLDTSASKITKEKMTARASSWADTDMWYGAGTYVAVAME